MKKPRTKIAEIYFFTCQVLLIIGAIWLFCRIVDGCEQQQEDAALGRSIRTGQPLSYPEENYDRPGE